MCWSNWKIVSLSFGLERIEKIIIASSTDNVLESWFFVLNFRNDKIAQFVREREREGAL